MRKNNIKSNKDIGKLQCNYTCTFYEYEKNHCTVKAILKVSDWFEDNQIHSIYGNYFVVGEWSELCNGQNIKIEGKMTRAITASLEDARLVYFSVKNPSTWVPANLSSSVATG